MADYSIIEFLVYGVIGYSGLIILMVSILLNPPTSRSLAGARSVWLSPSIICLFMLSFSGGIVMLETITETETSDYEVLNSADVVTVLNSTTTTTTTEQYNMSEPVWVLLHWAFALVLIVYIIQQTLNIFTKPE